MRLLVLALTLTATVAHAGPTERQRQLFAIPATPPKATVTPLTLATAFPGVTAQKVTYPSTVKTATARNNTVHGILFTPRRETRRAIVLLPWFKERDTSKLELIGQTLAAGGFKVLFIAMGYQFQRAPEGRGSGDYILKGPDFQHVQQWARQSVQDARRARQWLVATQGVAPDAVGLMGISLGGFIGSVTYGVAPEFKSATILLAGGDLARYVQLGAQAQIPQITEALDRLKVKADDLPRLLRDYDPVTYADPARKRGLMMINGVLDPVVPLPLAQSLWRAWGKPKLWRLPTGHVTSVAYVPLILARVVAHHGRLLGPPRK